MASMFKEVSYRFRKTKHFEPGQIKFKPVLPISMFRESDIGISMKEGDAVLFLCLVVAAADGEFADEEAGAMGYIFFAWPFFAPLKSEFKTRLEWLSQKAAEEGIPKLLEAALDTISKKNRAMAYAAAAETAYADQMLHKRELEFLDLLQARFSIDDATSKSIRTSAKIRYGT